VTRPSIAKLPPHTRGPAGSKAGVQDCRGTEQRPELSPISYIPSLDGIRAIAVTAVLVYHAGASWLPGGFLGVDVFFVLSGFLISSVLLEQIDRSGTIAFGRFYLGRARRLLPALLLVLVASSVLALTVARDAAERVWQDGLASLGYVTNWWYIAHGQSYFDSVGRPPLLQHLWSLAVEEQFYLVWPVVLWLAVRRFGRRGLRTLSIVGALASTTLMAAIAVSQNLPAGGDASRLYFGTDTHAVGLLVGAALATCWRPDRLSANVGPAAARWGLAGFVASLVGLGLALALFTQDSWFLYRGGFLVVSLLAALLIATASHPALGAAASLGAALPRWIGQRSYGIYLWHWPIFMVTRPGIDVPITGAWVVALSLGLTVLAADLSYRYVEMPIRRGSLARAWSRAHTGGTGTVAMRLGLPAAAAVTAVALLAVSLGEVPTVSPSSYLGGVTAVGDGELPAAPARGESAPWAATAPTTSSVTANPGTRAQAGPSPQAWAGAATAVGDSVLLGARAGVGRDIPGVVVDAVVSRQPDVIFARIMARKVAGALAPMVIVSAGTNGLVTKGELTRLFSALGDRSRVVILTVRVPRVWMGQTNSDIFAVARKYPNVRVADWSTVSFGHRDWFVSDGVHLTPAGISAFAAIIASTLRAP